MMEEKVMLATIFRNFNVEAAEKREDIALLAELIMRPRDGLHIKISPRKQICVGQDPIFQIYFLNKSPKVDTNVI